MKPICVIIEYDPWQMVIGSDSPTFALYDNGLVIYLKKEGDSGNYYSTKLKKKDINSFLQQLNLNSSSSFETYYELSNWTDQPTNLFYLDGFKVKVYGDLRNPPEEADEEDEFLKELAKEEIEQWNNFPNELLEIFKMTTSFQHADEKKWMPEHLEIIFWPYENAPDESIIWPEDWPDMKDSKTKSRGKETYSVYLRSVFYQKLIDFLKTREPKGAIKINDRKMTLSIRFPFPQEDIWMK